MKDQNTLSYLSDYKSELPTNYRSNHLDLSGFKQIFWFALIGISGVIVNTSLLYLFTTTLNWHYLIASLVATEAAIITNFLGNNFITFRGVNSTDGDLAVDKFALKFFKFQLISLTTITGTIVLLWVFTSLFGIGLLLIWNLMAISIMFVANYFLNRKYTWRRK